MIRSMTGYGSASLESGPARAAVSVRSLNHRFLDVVVHMPRRLQALEGEVKERVARVVGRGRVEVQVQANVSEGEAESVAPSKALVASLVKALRDMQHEFGLEGGVTVSDLLRFPGALERADPTAPVSEATRAALLELIGRALEELDSMRRSEGERLRSELERAFGAVEEATARIEARSAQTRETRRAELVDEIRELVRDLGLEEGRLYQEVVRAVERHDVAEEIQRLRSHVATARGLLAGDGAPAGKRLDFVAQELMREGNTIGSKIADAEAIRDVVGLKAEIERLREQVQNVE